MKREREEEGRKGKERRGTNQDEAPNQNPKYATVVDYCLVLVDMYMYNSSTQSAL